MGRAAQGQGLGPAASWPDWLLSHPGEASRDRARDPSLHNPWHEWNHVRAMWFASQHIKWSPTACTEEHRRRAAVWQALHPEDSGP
jgi:hypothetical protein